MEQTIEYQVDGNGQVTKVRVIHNDKPVTITGQKLAGRPIWTRYNRSKWADLLQAILNQEPGQYYQYSGFADKHIYRQARVALCRWKTHPGVAFKRAGVRIGEYLVNSATMEISVMVAPGGEQVNVSQTNTETI